MFVYLVIKQNYMTIHVAMLGVHVFVNAKFKVEENCSVLVVLNLASNCQICLNICYIKIVQRAYVLDFHAP